MLQTIYCRCDVGSISSLCSLTLSALLCAVCLPGIQFRMEEQREPGHRLQVSLHPVQEVLPSTLISLLHQAHKPLQAFIR